MAVLPASPASIGGSSGSRVPPLGGGPRSGSNAGWPPWHQQYPWQMPPSRQQQMQMMQMGGGGPPQPQLVVKLAQTSARAHDAEVQLALMQKDFTAMTVSVYSVRICVHLDYRCVFRSGDCPGCLC